MSLHRREDSLIQSRLADIVAAVGLVFFISGAYLIVILYAVSWDAPAHKVLPTVRASKLDLRTNEEKPITAVKLAIMGSLFKKLKYTLKSEKSKFAIFPTTKSPHGAKILKYGGAMV